MHRPLLPLLLLALLGAGCSEDRATCGPQNCSGCCMADGTCVPSPTNAACGKGGSICSICPVGTTCQNGICSAGNSSLCGPLTCSSGCCSANNCITNLSDLACGNSGRSCVDCTAQGGTCDLQRKTCGSSSCTPQCAGKCIGAPDNCGGECTSNGCAGCCDADHQCLPGNTNEACGSGGATCVQCTCNAGSCGGCTPNCAGKCQGAANTCGGTCPSNSCSGCCTSGAEPQCLAGNTVASCGQGGEVCDTCSSSEVCLVNQGCVTNPQDPCAGKTGGTTSCTAGGQPGKCWDNSCCTGCYDSPSANCYDFPWDFYCGKEGSSCINCDLEGKICQDGVCVVDESDVVTVTIASGKLLDSSPSWDTDGTEPDLELRIWWNNSNCAFADYSTADGCAPQVANTTFPAWMHSFDPVQLNDLLARPFCLVVLDQDGADCGTSSTDFVGSCQVQVTTSDLSSGELTVYGCSLPSGTNQVDFLHFTFAMP